MRDRFADGIAYVELAPLLDPDGVVPAVADAVDAPPHRGRTPLDALVARLRDRQLLLVLDNAEHVLDAAPPVAALVAGIPG